MSLNQIDYRAIEARTRAKKLVDESVPSKTTGWGFSKRTIPMEFHLVDELAPRDPSLKVPATHTRHVRVYNGSINLPRKPDTYTIFSPGPLFFPLLTMPFINFELREF